MCCARSAATASWAALPCVPRALSALIVLPGSQPAAQSAWPHRHLPLSPYCDGLPSPQSHPAATPTPPPCPTPTTAPRHRPEPPPPRAPACIVRQPHRRRPSPTPPPPDIAVPHPRLTARPTHTDDHTDPVRDSHRRLAPSPRIAQVVRSVDRSVTNDLLLCGSPPVAAQRPGSPARRNGVGSPMNLCCAASGATASSAPGVRCYH